ncbi:hypothetical protein ACA910_009608 [Epithemia clementina (nom. ined.)]
MKQVGYEHNAIVLETWDCAHFGSKNFDKEFGMVALERLFELQPRAKKVLGYDQGDEVGKSHANVHATAFAGLFDSVFQMIGPDLEFIQDILRQVGRRHKSMGVSPSFFPFYGAGPHLCRRKVSRQEADRRIKTCMGGSVRLYQ